MGSGGDSEIDTAAHAAVVSPVGRPPPWWRRALAVVMVVPVAVTIHRLLAAGLWWDEYYFVLARRMILETGVPRLPSGVLWVYGGPSQYLGAIGTWIGGLDVFWNRLPMAVPALLAPLVVARTARRLHGPVAGVAAAAVIALNPGYLQWTANAGIYGLLTLLGALATDRWCAWVLEERDDAARAFGLWSALATLCNPVAAAALPGLLIAAILRRRTGLRLRDVRWGILAVCVLALVAVFGLLAIGDPALLTQLPAEDREGASVVHHIASRGRRIVDGLRRHLLASAWHAVPAWLALLGGLGVLRGAGRLRDRRRTRDGDALLLIAPVIVGVILLSGLFRYRWERYLLPALPLIALGAGLQLSIWAARLRDRSSTWTWAVGAVLVALHVGVSARSIPAVVWRSAGQRRALEQLADADRPGDLILGGFIPAALHSDLATRRHPVWKADVGVTAHEVDGVLRDRLLGDVILLDLSSVKSAFFSADRVWYVVRELELERGSIAPATHRWLTENTRPVTSGGGLHVRRK